MIRRPPKSPLFPYPPLSRPPPPPREGGRRRPQPQVTEPDLLQVPQGAGQPRLAVKPPQRLIHGPFEHVVDGAATELHLEHLLLEALARADLTRHEHIGEIGRASCRERA